MTWTQYQYLKRLLKDDPCLDMPFHISQDLKRRGWVVGTTKGWKITPTGTSTLHASQRSKSK